MNNFIRVNLKNASVQDFSEAIINVDTIDVITVDNGITVLNRKDGTKFEVYQSIDTLWEKLKPSIIFA